MDLLIMLEVQSVSWFSKNCFLHSFIHYLVCWGCVPWHMGGYKRIICRSQSSLPMWELGPFTCWTILLSLFQCFVFFKASYPPSPITKVIPVLYKSTARQKKSIENEPFLTSDHHPPSLCTPKARIGNTLRRVNRAHARRQRRTSLRSCKLSLIKPI